MIELLMVVAILAIAAAVALPMLHDSPLAQLRSAGALVIADLGFAQTDSIAHGDAPRCFVVDQPNQSYWVAVQSTPNTPITNPADHQTYKVTFGQQRAAPLGRVSIQSYSFGGDNQLGFTSYGNLDQTTNATLTLTAGGHTLTITVDAASGMASAGTIQ